MSNESREALIAELEGLEDVLLRSTAAPSLAHKRTQVVARAIACIREAGEDSKRLDWMQTQNQADINAYAWFDEDGEGWTVRDRVFHDQGWIGEGPTLRAAIDSARSATATPIEEATDVS